MSGADEIDRRRSPHFRLAPAFRHAGSLRAGLARLQSYEIVWWLFAGCIVLGNIAYFAGETSGLLKYALAYGGSAGCAWAWLFTRALFRAEAALTKWPLLLLAATMLIEGSWDTTHGLAAAGETGRLLANAASFVCISMLALVFVEIFSGYNRQAPLAERRFRAMFAGFFGAALAITMLWSLNAPEGSLAAQAQAPARIAFGLLAVFGGRLAVEYRRKNPLTAATLSARRRLRERAPDEACTDLAGRIRHALEHQQLFATPKLKVLDLSSALGEPEFKVSQCITGVMGYQNFNRLVNAYRIEQAKTALRENRERQILTIALDCGFNSIGPFNRAFKEEAGMTPRQYRAERR